MRDNQSGKFTTTKKENVDFCLPEFSAKKIALWKYHVNESTDGRYGMILYRERPNHRLGAEY